MNNQKPFILAVSTGEGIGELLLELGADGLLNTDDAESLVADDFRFAIQKSGSDCLLVIPNGESAYAEAISAADSITQSSDTAPEVSRSICILPSKTFAEGYAALASMPFGESLENQYFAAISAISAVTPIDIRRESCDLFDKYSATSRGVRYSLAGSAEAALLESIEQLFLPTHRIITLIVGMGVSNARRVFATERLMEIYPDSQIIVYIGGQTDTEYYIAIR